MQKLLTSVLFLSALFIGLFANAQKTEAQYETQSCDKAILRQSVDLQGQSAQLWFEYWASNNSSGTKVTPRRYFGNKDIVVLSEEILSLTPLTNYSFRMVVEINTKTTKSGITTFTTPSCPLPTVTVRSDKAIVEKNGYATLSWTSTPSAGNSCSLIYDNRSVLVNPNSTGYQVGPITKDTVFKVSCLNGTGSGEGLVTVRVNQPIAQNPTLNFNADKTFLRAGETTTLRWSSTNTKYCNAGGAWSGGKNLSGTYSTGALNSDKTYILTCQNNDGVQISRTVNVMIDAQQNTQPVITEFRASPSSGVSYNGSTTLYWNSNNADYCTASEDWSGNKGTNGSETRYNLTNDKTYVLRCYKGNNYDSRTVHVDVDSQSTNTPTVNLTASDYNISNGDSVVLTWNSSNADYCYSSFSSNSATDGSITIYPTYTRSYSTTCYRGDRSANDSVTIEVNSNQNQNQSPSVSTTSANVLSNNTSATLNGYVNPNGTNTTRWFEWGTNSNYLSNSTSKINQGYSSQSFSETLYNLAPNTTYYFRAMAEGSNGQRAYGNILQFTTSNNNTYTGNNSAITTFASSITSSSARLNGVGLSNVGTNNEGWFEWGIDSGLSNPILTGIQNIGSSDRNSFSWVIESLGANKTYYYRAVIRNSAGVFKGEIVSFRTDSSSTSSGNSTTTNTTNNTTNNTVNNSTSKPSLVFLSVSRDGETLRQGDTVEYNVIYRNTSGKNLRNVVIRIAIPKEFEFVDTNRGSFSKESNMIVANGFLNPNESGEIRFRVKIEDKASINKVVVVTANAAYTIVDNNTQEEVFAYSTNTISGKENDSNLGALALFGGDGFLPDTLLGWLLLVLAVMGLILLGKRAYQGPANANANANGAHNSHGAPHDLPH